MYVQSGLRSLITALPVETRLILIWLIANILINPLGEFPINDDWAYSQNVWFLSEEGRLHFSDWPGMTLIAQTLFGATTTSIFGFSFGVLRITTLLFGLAFLLIYHEVVKKAGAERGTASFTVLLIGFSPLFLSLSFTFMTEIYFFCFFYLSLLFYFFYTNKQRLILLLLSSISALIAVLIRQTGIIIPVAFAIIELLRSGRNVRRIIISLIPLLIVAGGLAAYQAWLEYSDNVYGNFGTAGDLLSNIKTLRLEPVMIRTGIILMYPGLFLLPLSVRYIPIIRLPRTWAGRLLLAGILLAVTFSLVLSFGHFPAPNVFYNLGLGPRLVKDAYWGDNIFPVLSPFTWNAIKGFAVLGVYLLIIVPGSRRYRLKHVLEKIRTDRQMSIRATILLMCGGYFAYMILNRFFFDRYTLPVMILSAAGISAIHRPPSPLFKWISRSLMLIVIFFSVTAVHDFMQWNRARWDGLVYLTEEKGVSERRIDGGLEFNAWYGAGPYNPAVKGEKSWWFVEEDEYVLACGPIEGFSLHKSFTYRRWLPPGRDSVQILWHAIPGMLPYDAYPVICDCETLAGNPIYLLSLKDSLRFEGGPLRSTEHARSGIYSVRLDVEHPFAFLNRFRDVVPGETFRIRIWKYGATRDVMIAVGGASTCYAEFGNNVVQSDADGWDQLEMIVVIPEDKPCDLMGIFIWNSGEDEAWLDDLEIMRLPPE